MSQWTRVSAVDDCPEGTALELVAEGRIIALYHTEGEWFALDGVCPHQGGPLGKGKLDGCVVTCPWHGWQFDVRTGQHQATQALHHVCFEVKIDGDDVLVKLASD